MREENTSNSKTLSLAVGKDTTTANSATVLTFDGRGSKSLVLIDPKPITRQSILEALTKALPDYSTFAVSSCEDLIAMQEKSLGCVRLVIIHMRNAQLTDLWVQNALNLVKIHLTAAAIVLLSDRDDTGDISAALSSGVRGYIPTSVEAEVAYAALRLIQAGGTFVPAEALRSKSGRLDAGLDSIRNELRDDMDLTPRELSVVALLREGRPNKAIAAELDMQESTVKVHVRNIFKKLRVGNRTHAAFVANRLMDSSSPRPCSNAESGARRAELSAGCVAREAGVDYSNRSKKSGSSKGRNDLPGLARPRDRGTNILPC